MKLNLQLFTASQKSFVFCDYDWQTIGQPSIGNADVFFQKRDGVYFWECGYSTGHKLVESYLLYGEKFTEYIQLGDSSFVLYDSINEIVIAARDFMGNYPLYYYESPHQVKEYIFTFSMNALLASKLVEPVMNYAKIVEYIECDLHARPNNYTFYHYVYRLLPAYRIRLKQGQIDELKRYGKFNLLRYKSFTDEKYIERFRELFIKSVKKQTDSYNKIAASLSGGLDSSSICSVAQSLKNNPIYTFNFKPEAIEAQEDDYIKAVIDKWLNIHRTVSRGYSGYDALKTIIIQNAQPHFVLNHTIQLDLIAAAQQESCDAFLSGHWGDQVVSYGIDYIDELAIEKDWKNLKTAIENYFTYSFSTVETDKSTLAERKAKAARSYTIRLLWRTINAKKRWANLPTTMWILIRHFDCTLSDFFTVAWQRINQKKISFSANSTELIQAEIHSEGNKIMREYPAEILTMATTVNGPITFTQKRHLDIIFKGNQTYGQEEYFEVYRQNSLRSAQPFFDAELLELSLSVPLRIKFDEGRKRGTLRKALKDYLPEKIANRVTKAVFTNHYVTLFKELWKDFDANTPDNHPIWKIINKSVFDKNVNIVLDDQHFSDSRHIAMPSVMRVINLKIWLDYLESLKK